MNDIHYNLRRAEMALEDADWWRRQRMDMTLTEGEIARIERLIRMLEWLKTRERRVA